VRFRKLRIAFSVVCGIACWLLIVLWVRSYFYRDSKIIDLPAPHFVQFRSQCGQISCALGELPSSLAAWGPDRIMLGRNFTEPAKSLAIPISAEDRPPLISSFAFEWNQYRDGVEVLVPYSFLVLISGGLATAPWIKWSKRFSLRTLLIATTLVAAVLGLIVWRNHH
jgi:hypothetical protein